MDNDIYDDVLLSGAVLKDMIPDTHFIVLSEKDENPFSCIMEGLNECPFERSYGFIGMDDGFTLFKGECLAEAIGQNEEVYSFRLVNIPDDAEVYMNQKVIQCTKIIAGPEVVIEEMPEWSQDDYCLGMVSIAPECIKFVKNQTPAICKIAIEGSSNIIKYIKEPSLAMQIHSINDAWWNFKGLPNKTRELCEIAVLANDYNFRHVPNDIKTPDFNIPFLQNNGLLLQHIPEPTEDEINIAISENGLAIQYVKNQTIEIVKKAIDSNPSALRFVDTKYTDIMKQIIRNDPHLIKHWNYNDDENIKELIKEKPEIICYMDHPKRDLQLYALNLEPSLITKIIKGRCYTDIFLQTMAVEFNPNLLTELKNPSYKTCELAVGLNGEMIDHVPERHFTDEICWISLKDNPKNIRFMADPTEEMIEYIIENDPESLKFVDYMSDRLMVVASKKKPDIWVQFEDVSYESIFLTLWDVPECFQYMDQKNEDFVALACIINPNIVKYIKDKEVKQDVQKELDRLLI